MTRPTQLSIDVDALRHNLAVMRAHAPRSRIWAVVKANAYGHGLQAALAAFADADGLALLDVADARLLREMGWRKPLLMLEGAFDTGDLDVIAELGLDAVVVAEHQARDLIAAARVPPRVWIKLNTGMNRLGLSMSDAMQLVDDPSRPSAFDPVMIMSHLACADEPSHPMNGQQLQAFQDLVAAYEGIESSLCNSAAIHLGSDYHFDLTRPGISLYGGAAVNGAANTMLPVVTAEARILQIREAQAGESVSYGASHVLKRNSRLAIAAAGYADGWHRSLSGSGVALRHDGSSGGFGFVSGHRVPIVGRVTMDLTVFDITDLPSNKVKSGDYIELFGANISVDEAAKAAGTIGYELLTGLGHRYDRTYSLI